MNREIKLRAIIKYENGVDVIHFTLQDLITDNIKSLLLVPWLKENNQPDRFTGLHDSVGKEIFESDIFRHPDGKIFWIKWHHDSFRAFYSQYDHSSIGLQVGEKGQAIVVGNLYENPDLLEGKE